MIKSVVAAYNAYPLTNENKNNNEINARRLGFQQGYDQAEKEYKNQWISVDEALPEYDEDVFVRFISRFPNNTDEFEVGYCTRWRTLDKSVKTDSKGFSIIGDMEITHWMMIPTINNEEK